MLIHMGLNLIKEHRPNRKRKLLGRWGGGEGGVENLYREEYLQYLKEIAYDSYGIKERTLHLELKKI